MHAIHLTTARHHFTSRAPTLAAAEPSAAWEARAFTDLVPPATLAEARERRDELAGLLTRERDAAALFLLALADFDRRRGWERLGHASLFAFLTRELRLSSGAAQLRLSAARLLPRHPAVEAALRSGRLCISAVGQLARVLTPENEAEVLPRFLGLSAREAQEVAAEFFPCPAPPRREVVTLVPVTPHRAPTPVSPAAPLLAAVPARVRTAEEPAPDVSPAALHTYEVPTLPPAPVSPAKVEPLTADLRRLHITVSRGFLEKVAAARTGLSHSLPGATTEQVLEAALDLLLQKRASRRKEVRRPRGGRRTAATSPTTTATSRTTPAPPKRPHIPAAIEREVRRRDANRCQFPLDAGDVCGSTWQVELDHVVPLALGGPTVTANLRCACRAHNRYAAEQALGTVARIRRG